MPETRDTNVEGLESRLPDWAVGVLVTQAIALGIALVSPLTPSKTGSTWSPAELVWPDPGYLQKVLASFVTVNLLLVVIGLVAWVALRWGQRD